MSKMILTHVFAAFVFIALVVYQPAAEGLMASLIFAAVSLEMGFVAQHTKKALFRLPAFLIWCFAYPHIFNVLLGIADLSWDSGVLWTAEGSGPFAAYLAALVFALLAAVLSFRLFLKSVKLNRYLYYFLLPCFTLITSFFIVSGRQNLFAWSTFFNSPAEAFNQLLSQFAALNLPLLLGLTFIQLMLIILLGDD
ncbi:hypothetical protein AB3331_04250 [Streptococcus sp. H49]|uniref:hypothetical protein n=1 Tax=Streptococcus huangxiaojuni TaxID=3237239 RepID=UPI0034A5A7E9